MRQLNLIIVNKYFNNFNNNLLLYDFMLADITLNILTHIQVPNLLSFIRSNFPISKKRPPCAKQRTEACSLFSAREFNTKLTPSPLVSLITNCSKVVSLEFPIWLSLIYQIYKIK